MPLSLLNHSALALLGNARAFPLLPAALASVPFGFVLVRVRVLDLDTDIYCDVPCDRSHTLDLMLGNIVTNGILELWLSRNQSHVQTWAF